MLHDDENNQQKQKSTLKPLPDGSYEIYKSESKSFYYVLAAFIFSLASIYLLKGGFRIVGNIFLFGFIGAAAVALKLVLFKKTVLVVNHKFIMVTPLVGPAEQILWDDIVSFKEVRDKRNHYIAVMVNDPEHILELQTNTLTYKLMHHNIKLYGTPFLIHTNTLNAHRKEIIKLLEDFHAEFLEQGVI